MKITKLKLEDELHINFKSEVAKNASNMQETMVKLIEKYLANDEMNLTKSELETILIALKQHEEKDLEQQDRAEDSYSYGYNYYLQTIIDKIEKGIKGHINA